MRSTTISSRDPVAPAVLLPVRDDVVGVERVDGDVRLDLGVLVEHGGRPRLTRTARSPAATD